MTDKNLLRSPESNSNELFDRVAVAIAGELFSDRHDWGGEIDCDLVADAVIAALGLRSEKGQRSNATGPLWGSNNRHTVTRYVTEWTVDE